MTASSEIFLVDSDTLIKPYMSFYPFDFADRFWVQLAQHISEGSIVILDMVKSEVECGNDELSEWVKMIDIGRFIDHREPGIIAQYSKILDYIQKNNCYKPSALTEWSRATSADPWLIATSIVYGYTIITFEVKNSNLNTQNPSKSAKIPDICSVFDVNTDDLYYMMRKLGITL